jgi:hypothetical protein
MSQAKAFRRLSNWSQEDFTFEIRRPSTTAGNVTRIEMMTDLVAGLAALVLLGELALRIDAERACAEERAENPNHSGGYGHSASFPAPKGLAGARGAFVA